MGHNYFGHPIGTAPAEFPVQELLRAECVAGSGLKGDRFFNYKENYKAQVTFFSLEVYQLLCDRLQVTDRSPSVFRRNIIVSGVDLNSLIGKVFYLQGISFYGVGEARPCHWMNEAFAPGAENLMFGRGGLRARILSNGYLIGNIACAKSPT